MNSPRTIDRWLRAEYRLNGQPDLLLWEVDVDGHMEETAFEALDQKNTWLAHSWKDMMRLMAHQETARAINERNKARALYLARSAIRAWPMGDVRGQYASQTVHEGGSVAGERQDEDHEVNY
jgi:hypothetical protein